MQRHVTVWVCARNPETSCEQAINKSYVPKNEGMRILALDIGEKRIGVAVSDPAERIATPVCVVPTTDVMANAPRWRRVIEDWEPELLLCGLPLTLAGEEGPQAQRVKQIASALSESTGLPLAFADERLSSTEAKRSLRDSGYDEAKMRGKIDMVAASLFLQAWLDARAM